MALQLVAKPDRHHNSPTVWVMSRDLSLLHVLSIGGVIVEQSLFLASVSCSWWRYCLRGKLGGPGCIVMCLGKNLSDTKSSTGREDQPWLVGRFPSHVSLPFFHYAAFWTLVHILRVIPAVYTSDWHYAPSTLFVCIWLFDWFQWVTLWLGWLFSCASVNMASTLIHAFLTLFSHFIDYLSLYWEWIT